ncbi:MAG TPA: flagellar basal-body MS-ring/collar protein FliF [Thermotogota bacterium]|nr:flagellar basal-body MS-ring/collar protein FliF [Thermotogota bacterium]HPJ89854.1 flagellar basal-body MS-ring/collar protein FliF [Thermotogota bacterium]HPR95927.1 flagellar basal-body MS-ring/collar protein FliF [Thermotogota bacterium]
MDFFNNIVNWVKSFPENYWKKFSQAQKIMFVGTIAAVVIALVLTISVAANPNYTLLVRGLTDSEAGKIVQQLEEEGVPYKTGSAGAIYVPQAYNPEALRMKYVSSGIIGNTSQGFEIMENQPLGATSFDKQVRYQIALKGELERTIMSIDGVEYAQVNLTIPKFTYYARGEESKPKASVLLVLGGGTSLNSNNVKAIMQLVSGAVEGLDYEEVRVVDNNSRILSDSVIDEEDVGSASSKMELQEKTEEYYTKKVRSNLEQVFGIGRVVVMAEILLNWETIERESTEYSPVLRTTGIVVSEQTESETSRTGSSGQVVGTDANIPPTYETTSTSNEPTYERDKTTTNYNVNEAYQKILQNNQGEILDKNITVLIDSMAVATGVTTDSIKAIVANSIDATITNVEVAFLAFDRSTEQEMESQMKLLENQQKFIQLVIGVTLLAISMMLLIYLMTSRVKKRKKRQEIIEKRMAFEHEVQQSIESEELSGEEQELIGLLELLYRTIEEKPEEIAMVLKAWLNE